MDSLAGLEKVIEIDEKDVNTPDEWIPRHPEIIRLTGRHPLNCEPPLSKLMSYGFITPASIHYVRNHGAVPRLEWDSHTISVCGLVGRKVELKMDDLISRFEVVSLPVTLVCCGNRRKEQNLQKKTIGFNWGAAGVSTSIWTGVRLRDVLTFCEVKESEEGANHICFVGADALPGGFYGTSITRNVAMDPSSDVLLAWEQNGERLLPDHGFPIRLIVPGYIGGRMVKWLTQIEVTKDPSENYYHHHDNKVLPPQIDAEQAKLEGWWYKPDYTVNELNINSVIASPAHNETVLIPRDGVHDISTYKFKGYAYTGGGRKVIRVELSFDDGASWELCDLNHPENPSKYGKYFCWCFWEREIPIWNLLRCAQVMVRAWDSAQNTQPVNMTWNVMGMMNNCTFKILVHLSQSGNSSISLNFEHPTLPGTQHGGWMSPKQNESVEAVPTKVVSDKNNTGVAYFTLEEVQKHTTKDSCWFIHSNKVYNSTSFLSDHPGGGESILLVAGGDATEEFDSLHSEKAHKLLREFYIGELTTPDVFSLTEAKNQQISRNLYEKLGGATSISALVNLFYDEKVMKDQRLQPIFDGKDIVSLRNHQAMFLSYVLGGPNGYSGRSMRDAHRGLGISEPQWKAVCQHLISSLEELGVSSLDIASVVERVLPLKNEIIEGNEMSEAVKSMSINSSSQTALKKQKSLFKLIQKEEVTHNTRRLRFVLPSPTQILGLPVGQHMFISAKIDDSTCIRAYTPLTGNEVRGYFDLLIKVYFKNEHPNFPEGGKMSQFLNNLQIGDSIEARGPVGHIEYKGNGTFHIDGQAVFTTSICMLAGGTGITPMYQVMSAILREPNDLINLYLVYANNTEDDILLESELEQFANKTNCKVFHTLAKPNKPLTWKGGVGFITQSMLSEHLAPPSEETIVFMCGPPPMLKFACLPSLEALRYNMSKCFTF